jgi:hypothetical protein
MKPARVTMFMPKRMSWVSICLATIVLAPSQREPNQEIGRCRDLFRKSRRLISPFPSLGQLTPAQLALSDAPEPGPLGWDDTRTPLRQLPRLRRSC